MTEPDPTPAEDVLGDGAAEAEVDAGAEVRASAGDDTPDAVAGEAPNGDAAPADPGAPVDSDASVAEAAEIVEADLAALGRERDEYLDSLRRLQADFENFKKRSMRQQTEALDRAAEQLVTKLLPVLDAVELARQHGTGEGVEQIATALFDILTKEGLRRVGEVDEPFDPNLHEAVAHEPGDGGAPALAEVMRAGWSWKGRLLRAAMVKVRG